jgi:circadian clock protein KaiC
VASAPEPTAESLRLRTGIDGLDEVLRGGFLPGRTYMVRGGPGVGKTALGLHFLAEGIAQGESVVFLSHGADNERVVSDAASIGVDASAIRFLDFTPTADFFEQSQSYDVFSPSEVERESFAAQLVKEIRDAQPARVFLDALTQVRHLSSDLFDFRRQAHAFLRFLAENGATVVFASGSSDRGADEDLQFMSDGVLNLDYSPTLGRTLTISKLRGSGFRLGQHSAKIDDGGFHLYPRLLPESFGRETVDETIPSGIPELDAMLHGGIEHGAVTLITGPTGSGKTTLATQFLTQAAEQGERGVIYTFEESKSMILRRTGGIGMRAAELCERGDLAIVEIEPLHYTPDQFALEVRREVERRQARIVLVDSTSGYRLSLQGEDLVAHLHALCKYLKNMGVTVLLTYEVTEITGAFRATQAEISYLADNIVFLRYVELDGELRRVVGVLKKRMTDFEKTLRELTITSDGVVVGEPLVGYHGVLSGTPTPAQRRVGET